MGYMGELGDLRRGKQGISGRFENGFPGSHVNPHESFKRFTVSFIEHAWAFRGASKGLSCHPMGF